jgi:hypothetical protein
MQPKTEKPLYTDVMAHVLLMERRPLPGGRLRGRAILSSHFSLPGKSRAKRITSIAARQFGRLAKTAFITPAGTLDLHLSPVDEMI